MGYTGSAVLTERGWKQHESKRKMGYNTYTHPNHPGHIVLHHEDGSWAHHDTKATEVHEGKGYNELDSHLFKKFKTHGSQAKSSQHAEEQPLPTNSSSLGLYLHVQGPPLGAAIHYNDDEEEVEAFSEEEGSEQFGESDFESTLKKHGYEATDEIFSGGKVWKHPTHKDSPQVAVHPTGHWIHGRKNWTPKQGKGYKELADHLAKVHK